MLDTMLSFFWPEGMAGLTYADMEFDVTQFQGKMDLIYETKDRCITAGAVSDKEWAGMCRAIEREDLIDDPRFKAASDRFINGEERKTLTAAELVKWSSEDILKRLDEQGVPCAPLLSRMELMEHEQIIANESIQRIEYEGFGEVRQPRPAAQFDKTPAEIAGPGPRLGQHSREILSRLGYSAEEVDSLIAKQKVIASE